MQSITFVLLAAAMATAMALEGGQYYVPRAYYIIDAEGHESAPVPLRRLRRSLNPYPYVHSPGVSANANANANADARGWGEAKAHSNANTHATTGGRGSGVGGWGIPSGEYGSSNPSLLGNGMTVRQSGPVLGRAVSASTSVGVDSSGLGYFDQSASVSN